MYRRWPTAALACIALSLAVAACGGGGSSTTASRVITSRASEGAAGGGTAGGGARSGEAAGGKAGAGEAPAAGAKTGCEARLVDFVARMDDLRQALLSGLDYSEYVVRVKAIRDAYEAVPVDKLGLACLGGAAVAAEDAFNQYLRAANVWGECAGTAGCAASSIEGRLQHHWHLASKGLDEAKRG